MSQSPPLLPESTVERLKACHPPLITDPRNGKRSISLQLLSPPNSSSPCSSRSVSSSTAETDTHDIFVAVPTHLESAAAFEFIGYTPEAAKELYSALCKHSEYVDTIEVANYRLEFIPWDVDDQDEWRHLMTLAGIKMEIQDALMREEHRIIRSTQSLVMWLYEIIETNYLVLEDLNATILSKLEPTKLPLRGGGDIEEYTVPQTPGGHLALFKSVEFRRAAGTIAEDGSIDLLKLISRGPTDFARHGGLYFTHQLWVAKHYAALLKDLCPLGDRRTFEMHVPLHHFQSVGTLELGFNDDYKQLVYHSRRNERYPKNISKLRAKYGVIRGPIARSRTIGFGKMQSWEEITDKNQLITDDDDDEDEAGKHKKKKVGMQNVWFKEETIEKLQEDVHGKCYLRKPHQGFKLIPEPWNDRSVADECGI
ncbi:hypothetical protein BKA66DRAFT_5492 [Pyrenochaeta sp. MPI-SDFR-AT-0127]|nr:hypothetical protein BKA66DRAFT_5492 [Pyrenochaeta sp. MPI-SDFR-AT-0127]